MKNNQVYKLAAWSGNLNINYSDYVSLNKSSFSNSQIFDLLKENNLFLSYTISVILKDSNNNWYLCTINAAGNTSNIDDTLYSIINIDNVTGATKGVIFMEILNFILDRNGLLKFKVNHSSQNVVKNFTITRVNVVLNYAIKTS